MCVCARVVTLPCSTLPLPAQILTKDSVTATVDGVVYFRVFNPTWAKVKVDNYHASTWLIAQTTLRNVLGTKTLAQLLLDREAIADELEVCGVYDSSGQCEWVGELRPS